MEHIIIVGGGAGGLSLATRLGRHFHRKRTVQVSLIDRSPTHLWKPLLHEVAAGTIDAAFDELNFRFHGRRHHFQFIQGSVNAVDPSTRTLTLSEEVYQHGRTRIPKRELHYDYLVLAVGGVSNDFGVPGALEHCYFLDSKQQAEQFHSTLLEYCMGIAHSKQTKPTLNINIIGGGATGVELAAELTHTAEELRQYTSATATPVTFRLTLLEAGPRILPALSEKLSASATKTLEKIGVDVRCGIAVKACRSDGLETAGGDTLAGDLQVWAAGVKAPGWLSAIEGLQTNNRNQLTVLPDLRCCGDEHIFAIGDCASLMLPNGGFVPPRAQAAHQMADVAYKNILRLRKDKSPKAFHYRDFGSLVSLSRFNTVGGLFGGLACGELRIGGFLARIVYLSLYRMHLVSVHGLVHSLVIAFAARLHRKIKPRLKLH
ncbi:NAD(P)/FAD-dependent oxidoreductase [Spongiibacter nanhainus]|uniref:NAD(P)/FAD-dependent oxidoreductase n=1 Tax=Spongiibacter nanhainus TaxID=2794344 RepID=A0A7T4UR12_9GAMM|nr:NAD(P)/FAD-dependent oxidoreductase [Spongiibacter nanhainus]QQD17870.1 NAD(P)/FAD-dependent oxidoreductase [Spongiibacter nanhainus]